MLSNSLSYLLLFVVLLFLYIIERFNKGNIKLRNRLRISTVTLFVLYFGFRGFVGTDWFNYNLSYTLTEWNQWTNTDYEPGFSILVKSLKLLGFSYFNVVAVLTIIQFYLFDKVINRYFSSIVLPYIMLLALFPIVIIDLQRNFLSILILMFGIELLEKGKVKKFYLIVCLACLFHLSAIVMLILPFLNRFRFKKTSLLILFGLGFVAYILQYNFYKIGLEAIGNLFGGRLGELIGSATRDDETAYGITFGILEKVFMSIFLISTYRKINKKYLIFANLCIIYLLVYFYFSTSQSFINRFANLFLFGYLWYYVFIFEYYKNLKGIGAVSFFFIMFLGLRVLIGYSPDIYMYKNILWEEENYYERVTIRSRHYE